MPSRFGALSNDNVGARLLRHAVELAFQVLDRDSQVVVLGAGEAAEGVLRSLHQQGASSVTLMNRHPEKAGVLASAWGARAGAWNELDETLAAADLLFVATGSRTPVITADQLSRVVEARTRPNLMVVDLSIPRNVEPAARLVRELVESSRRARV